MKSAAIKSNFRIIVTVQDYWLKDDKHWELIMYKDSVVAEAEIKRHIDNISNTEIKFDVDYKCTHCGSKWTELSDKYNGGCCEEDIKNEISEPDPLL